MKTARQSAVNLDDKNEAGDQLILEWSDGSNWEMNFWLGKIAFPTWSIARCDRKSEKQRRMNTTINISLKKQKDVLSLQTVSNGFVVEL